MFHNAPTVTIQVMNYEILLFWRLRKGKKYDGFYFHYLKLKPLGLYYSKQSISQSTLKSSFQLYLYATVALPAHTGHYLLQKYAFVLSLHITHKHAFFFWSHHVACGTLVSCLRIKPKPLALVVQSLNH